MSAIINGDSPSVTFSDGTTQSTAFTAGAVTQSTIATGVAGTGPTFSGSGNTSIPDSVNTKMGLGTENWDTNSNFATGRFTPTVAGYYQINATISISGSFSGIAQAKIYKNGAITTGGGGSYLALNGTTNPATAACIVSMNGTTDYIELYALQTSGGTITVGGAMQGCLIRAA